MKIFFVCLRPSLIVIDAYFYWQYACCPREMFPDGMKWLITVIARGRPCQAVALLPPALTDSFVKNRARSLLLVKRPSGYGFQVS
jgi:hypothetical protein